MNVLALGAHYDDIELGCSGSLAKHTLTGDTVYVFVATDSGYCDAKGNEIRGKEEALKEGMDSSAIIGANLISGNHKTFYLDFEEPLNAQLIQIIEEKHIELIYTQWTYDVHHDHSNLAKAALHVSRHVPKILMYRSNFYPSPEPFHENFYVDISMTWEKKKRAILAHQSECQRVGFKWIEYFEREALNNGLKIGVTYAEAFQAVKWLM